MNALVVDDSRAMRKILRSILLDLGYQIIEAEHGLDAIEKLKENDPFEIALVDWNMPEMNGLEFVQHVRENSDHDNMKLVMVTTETEPDRMVKALMAGVDEFVMKPFTPEILIDKLRLIGVSVNAGNQCEEL